MSKHINSLCAIRKAEYLLSQTESSKYGRFMIRAVTDMQTMVLENTKLLKNISRRSDTFTVTYAWLHLFDSRLVLLATKLFSVVKSAVS